MFDLKINPDYTYTDFGVINTNFVHKHTIMIFNLSGPLASTLEESLLFVLLLFPIHHPETEILPFGDKKFKGNSFKSLDFLV